MLADGAAWLAGQLRASAGRSVSVSDGSTEVTLTATIGASRFEAVSQSGVSEVWESRDFIVDPDDLAEIGDPARGWTITDTVDGTEVVYEVRTPPGIPEWRYGDAFRETVRIHTVVRDTGVVILTTEGGEPLLTESGDLLIA